MKNNPLIFSLLIIMAFLALAVVIALFGVRRVLDSQQNSHDQVVPITSARPYQEYVHPTHDGINVLNIYLKNTRLENTDNFIFTLSENGIVARQIIISGRNIGDGENIRFQFAPLADSAGKTYLLSLGSDTESPAQAISVGYSSSRRAISYEMYYQPQNKVAVLKEILSQNLSRLSWPLFASWISAGIISFFILRKDIIQV